MLDSLKIKFYDELDPINWSNITDNAYAFVKGFKLYSDNTIYINLTQNDPEPFDTLIHEIQHIIYNIKPLNPEEKIRDIFVTKNTKRATPNSIESSLRPTNNDYNEKCLLLLLTKHFQSLLLPRYLQIDKPVFIYFCSFQIHIVQE